MPGMYQHSRFLPAGDMALSIELGDDISPETNRRVRDLSLALQMESIPGIIDQVPTYRSVLLYYDPLRLPLRELQERLRTLEERPKDADIEAPNLVEIPTVYGGEYGPDLDHVAEHTGLTTEEVIRLHSGADYLVYMMGFTPGFTYLGGMSERIATPRLQTPRTAIPAGSVGIAERQTGIYPTESPGGWQLIGRTPLHLFDPQRDPPVVVDAGDYVRFVPINESAYLELDREARAGTYEAGVRPAPWT